ncbi:peptide chain release factor 1 [Alkalibaculum sp. M08DMB]|uniref:Peptide chain release factor 1 n=1 Tax=Alkalibaculum sporogenes TaxID=2655001 RepID=A0A6A7K9T0_9FIRM|nr:peptide chain release factor 1 [Alkalibaculum sporogenes]MPW26184.1 peptide chain release factor 1 [Alkalibaculum sporogenes]
MLDKLESVESRYIDLEEKVSDPEVIANQNEWRKLVKEHSKLETLVKKYREYKIVIQGIDEAKEMLKDKIEKDFKEMVELELEELNEKEQKIKDELTVLLLPQDPNDDKSVIVEIRAGAGGSEAALFAGSLFRMYTRYAERQKWKYEVMSSNIPDIGGIKEIVFSINADGAYSKLKYESGVHRVQRIPTTESGGRIHTSTVTVAVLAEVEDVEIDIKANDIRTDVYRSSGNGGQSVNTTDSAVRVTHVPTGLVVTCQDGKSQLKNKDKAMTILKAKLYELEQSKQNAEVAQDRKSQVGTGDRSERIRTYNFPQGRITDHRIGLTLYKLDQFLDGDIEEMVESLTTTDQAEKLKMQSE